MAAQEATTIPARGPGGWRQTLDLVATILMILAGATILAWALKTYLGTGAPPPREAAIPVPSAPISLDGAARRGSPTARVALIEHSDFECPFCGKFEREVLPELTKRYVDPGRVQLIFRNDPLPMHALARPAAEAAVCAGEQGKFWEAHDLFFGNQAGLRAATANLPATLKLTADRYQGCLARDSKARVDADVKMGEALHVTGTPAFFIGTLQADGRVRSTKHCGAPDPWRTSRRCSTK